MLSSFVNYNTSYYDILKSQIPDIGPFTDNRIIGSSDGELIETGLTFETSSDNSSISTANSILSLGEKYQGSNLSRIEIGYELIGGPFYPNFKVEVFPPTEFYQGVKLRQNISRYNNADLWVRSLGGNTSTLKYRDRNVVSSPDGTVSGNIAIFGGSEIGDIEDSGMKIETGIIVLTLFNANSSIDDNHADIDFDYQKIGNCVQLSLRKHMFQGDTFGNPIGFESRNSTGVLPTFLRPRDEVSCPILIYQQISGGSSESLPQLPMGITMVTR